VGVELKDGGNSTEEGEDSKGCLDIYFVTGDKLKGRQQ